MCLKKLKPRFPGLYLWYALATASVSTVLAVQPYHPLPAPAALGEMWRWHHIVELDREGFWSMAAAPDGAVRFGVNNVLLHDDGNLVNSTPATIPPGDIPTAAMPFFMGGEPGAVATEHFSGGLDDVVIYDDALTLGEVINVMNGIYEF